MAIKLYREAYALNHADSGYHLALMIAYGRGTSQDASAAMEIFRKCSLELNHAPSMRYLGIFAVNGHGAPDGISDYQSAVAWFDKCARTGDPTVGAQCGRERDEVKSKINGAEAEIREKMSKYEVPIDIDITPYD